MHLRRPTGAAHIEATAVLALRVHGAVAGWNAAAQIRLAKDTR
jgi:hypothetical protein